MKQFDVLITMYPGGEIITIRHDTAQHAQEFLDKAAGAIAAKCAFTIGTMVLNGAYIISAKRRLGAPTGIAPHLTPDR